MIDMLFKFNDEDDAMEALEPFGLHDGDIWDDSRVKAPVFVTRNDGTPYDGFWVAMSTTLEHGDPELEDLAVLVLKRDIDGESLSDFVSKSTMTDLEIDAIGRIQPIWEGSSYPLSGVTDDG